MLIEHSRGNYRFLRGISPYSSGVLAAPGYEIVHATLDAPLPFRAGFQWMARHLASLGRPMQALCAIELRSPRPFSFEGFNEFNSGYLAVLAEAEVLVEGLNPVARTNVAPELHPPMEPALYAFSYTAPHPGPDERPTFVVAGAGELLEGRLEPQAIVRQDDVSPEALREKAAFVMGSLKERVRGLGVGWDQVSVVNIYTVHDILPFLPDRILGVLGAAGRHGVRWHFARPPIIGLEYEMDVRSIRTELHLSAG